MNWKLTAVPLYFIALTPISDADAMEDEAAAEARRNVIKNKIKAVGKMARVFNVLRQENESIAELKNLLGTKTLPTGSLALGAEGIKRGTLIFEDTHAKPLRRLRMQRNRMRKMSDCRPSSNNFGVAHLRSKYSVKPSIYCRHLIIHFSRDSE